MILEAINPGSNELLRASVDYDGIPPTDTERFNLVIHRLASRDRPIVEQQEVYRGLSTDITETDFVGNALLGSELICVKQEIPGERPDVTLRRGIEVGASYIYVDSDWPESDGLTDYDLIGSNIEGTGLFALDQLPSIGLVNLVTDAAELGPVALFTAERYCRERNAILLVDPPVHWRSVDDAIRFARESGFASPNVATYFPRPTASGQMPASALGAFAGALAARDARDGIWGLAEITPLEMRGRVRLPVDLDIEEQHALKRAGINALKTAGPSHLELTGLVTLNRGSGCVTEWDELCLRRTALIIIDSIARGTRWAAFQDNDIGTRGELREQVRHYLNDLFADGALSGKTAEDAGYVVCNSQTNLSSARDGHETSDDAGISFDIGFMPQGHGIQSFRFHQRPAECRVRMLHIGHPVALAG